MNPFAGAALLFVRGLMLWLVVPIAVLTWPFAALASKSRLGLGVYLGWIDLNLIAALQRLLLARKPVKWTSFRTIGEVTHRVGRLDAT